MNRCHYCAYSDGQHNRFCPESETDTRIKGNLLAIWRLGYNRGRIGGRLGGEPDETARLGFLRGEVALEEAQNSEQW